MGEVFYRKWRPRRLGDVVGQERITRTLLNALATGRIAHAYLFFGPRGTGKTSTGRILAKAVNCLGDATGEPCGSCDMCLAFEAGRAIDLIEIDAASNRGIDEIRDLKDRVNFAPNIARYKVYIIDEVHMLTEPAFNALLKTLEEPPPHVIFVLATTEVHKVPATIISRCQRFDFRRIPLGAMMARLKLICEEEGIKADDQALTLMARGAMGSLRDAENLLEQFVVYHGPRIELEQVRAELGLTGDLRVRDLAKHILRGELSAGMLDINSAANDGLDLRQFNRAVVEYLRGLMLVKADAAEVASIGADELEEMKRLGAETTLDEVSQALKLFAQADFRFTRQSTLPLELALVDYVLQKPEEGRSIPEKETASPALMQPPAREKTVSQASPAEVSPGVEHIKRHWNDFVNACRGAGSRGNLDALLRRSCMPVSLEGNTLVLGFSAEYHKAKIEDPKYGRMVEAKLEEVFGTRYQVHCVLVGRDANAMEEARKTPSQKPASANRLVEEAVNRGARIISEE